MRPPILHLYLILLLALGAQPAHAYLDPASGSMLLQVILGGIAGVAVMAKLFWHKLLKLVGMEKKDEEPPA